MTIKTRGAISCAIVLKGKPYVGITYPKGVHGCGDGMFKATIRLGDNPFTVPTTATFWVLANSGGTTVHKSFSLTDEEDYALNSKPVTTTTLPSRQPTAPTTTTPAVRPPIVNLNWCVSGTANCYIPTAAYATYPNWGNGPPDLFGDCTFAAAANWEMIVLGASPDATAIGYEFAAAAAGGTASGGLSQNALFAYWQRSGISGVTIKGVTSYETDQTNVQNGVLDYKALIVELQLNAGWGFGQYTMTTTGGHDAVVIGYTPTGPLVVTWGQTIQMTWAQWSAEVVAMFGITA